MPNTVLRDAPDGGDLVPVSLHRKDRTRLDRLAVDVDRAGPATGRVASRMHAPDPKVLPEMVEQQQPRFHLSHVGVPVHRHLDPTQPSLLSLKWTKRLYVWPHNSRSTGFHQTAVNVFNIRRVFPQYSEVSRSFPLSSRK